MDADELAGRTKAFSLRIMKLVAAMPQGVVGWEMGKQLLRSGLSVSANYRAARRARSRKEFVAKICIVVEEVDETAHWLSLVIEGGVMPKRRVASLAKEADELVRIFATMRASTVRNNRHITTSPNHHIEKDQ